MALEATKTYVSAVEAYCEEVALLKVAMDLRRARVDELSEAIRVATETMRASRARAVEEFFADEE